MIFLEIVTRNIPSTDKTLALYLEKEKNNISTLILGASQNKRAIDPKYLSLATLNMAHSRQDYWIDYQLLQKMSTQLPSLQRVVISSTARHFESPVGRSSWQFTPLLLHYDLNIFNRTTYFKDRLLFLSNPRFYDLQLRKYYLHKDRPKISELGYYYDSYRSPFIKLNLDSLEIQNTYVDNYPKLNKKNISYNYPWFSEIVKFCNEQNLDLVITSTPTLEIYNAHIDPLIIRRRDSILQHTVLKFPDVKLFNQENDISYKIEDFYDYNHLNHKGAEKFTKRLDNFIMKNFKSK